MLDSRTREGGRESVTWEAKDPMSGSVNKDKRKHGIVAQRPPLFQHFYLNYINSLQS